ncbi:MAG TPA: hypothetical protein VIL36_22095 [Acidimicrobiales bacterium]
MGSRRWTAAAVAGVAVALVALVTGCTGDDDPLARTESIDSSSPQAGEGAEGGEGDATGEEGDGGAGSGSAGDGGGSGEVLGTARASLRANAIDNRSTPLRLDVVRLDRHGDLIELGLVLTNEAEPPADGESSQDFKFDSMLGGGPGPGARYDASNVALVDGDAQKLYLPVLDSSDVCLCTDGLGAIDVPPGGQLTIDATYGGVPDDVEALDVRVPNFPVITGVPVS